jgi:hypothetical protein
VVLVVVYVTFRERFTGLTVGYKDLKVETPKPSLPEPAASEKIVENPTADVDKKKTEELDTPPLLALLDAVDEQNRAGIEAAYEKLKDNPPF